MAFNREVDITKDATADFEIVFFVPDPFDLEGVQAGQLNVQIKRSDGSIESISFDLLERLQDDAAGLVHLTNLASLRDYIRIRLNNEVLPL